MTSYISLDYRAQEGFIYRIARDDEEESSLLKKLLPRQGLHHRQRIWRQAHRARAGAHREGRAAQAGTAAFRRVRARASHAGGQRRIGEAGAGSGVRDHAADSAPK